MVTNEKKKKVALYIRVSTEEQAEMYGVELQKASLKNLIASKSLIYEFAGNQFVYIDEGISGSTKPEERPAFRRLIEDVSKCGEDKPFDIVAVYKIDRFARRLKILLDILDFFQEQGLEFISANENIDTSTPFGRAMLGIIGVIAELELENIKTRTTDGRNTAAREGKYLHTPPLGYVKDENGLILIQEEEAKVVKDIFNMFTNYRRSRCEIAENLRDRKIPTPLTYQFDHKKQAKGKRQQAKGGRYAWETSMITTILKNELYIGIQYYNRTQGKKKLPKEEWGVHYHNQIIIDKELFNRTQQLLKHREVKVRKGDSRIYLLQGLLKCANCFNPLEDEEPYLWHGAPHNVKSTGKKAYYYLCSSKHPEKKRKRAVDCKALPLPALKLEQYIKDFVIELIDKPEVIFKYQQKLQSQDIDIKEKKKNLKNVNKLLNNTENTRENILNMFQEGDITLEQKRKRIKEVEEQNTRLLKEKELLEAELSIFTHEDEYLKVLSLFSKKYKKVINQQKTENSQDIFDLIHMVIDEIIVFSRPKKKTDIVTGRPSKGQMIPYKLKIVLKVPAEMVRDLLSSLIESRQKKAKFHAEKSQLCRT